MIGVKEGVTLTDQLYLFLSLSLLPFLLSFRNQVKSPFLCAPAGTRGGYGFLSLSLYTSETPRIEGGWREEKAKSSASKFISLSSWSLLYRDKDIGD